MKVGVLLLHTATGWSANDCGGDIRALKAKYKAIKTTRTATVDGKPADLAILLTTGGDILRTRLDDPEATAARERIAAAEAAREKREAEQAAAEQAADVADQAGKAAVAAVEKAIATASETAEASAAPESADSPAEAAPAATEEPADSDEGDDSAPANHFAAAGRKRRG